MAPTKKKIRKPRILKRPSILENTAGILLNLDVGLIARIDRRAHAANMTRTAYMRAILEDAV